MQSAELHSVTIDEKKTSTQVLLALNCFPRAFRFRFRLRPVTSPMVAQLIENGTIGSILRLLWL